MKGVAILGNELASVFFFFFKKERLLFESIIRSVTEGIDGWIDS